MKFLNSISNKQVHLLFIVLGFLLYGNTLGHDYTLDDALVITENDITKDGFAGIWDQLSNDQFVGFYGEKKSLVAGGRYRPLSMVVFNIQVGLFGTNPFIGHLCNVLFYILCGILLYHALSRLLGDENKSLLPSSLALLISGLWFFHPIHTEVVANIKGLDEMMAFCGELLVLLFILRYLDKPNTKDLLLISVIYFLALLSKENAITWLAIFPLAVFIFRTEKFKQSIPVYSGLLAAAVIWFLIRYQVVGGGISNVADNLMNDPFLESSTADKYATIVFTLGKYLQLMLFPHPLTFDYYPKHIPIKTWSDPLVILSLLSYIALGAYCLYGILKKQLAAFGIAIFLITLSIASNLVFPIGAFMNERFVFVSSLGFAILFALFLKNSIPKWFPNVKTAQASIKMILIIFFAGYSLKTISRNMMWKDNLTLSTNDAEISVNGAKSQVMAGGLLSEEAAKTNDPIQKNQLLDKSIFHLNRALNIYPEYIDALVLMGNAQWERTKNAKMVIPFYQRVLEINPQHDNTWQNISIVLEQSKDPNFKIQAYTNLIRFNGGRPEIYLNIGRCYGREKNDLNKAVQYFESGLKIAPNNYSLLTNLGTVYGMTSAYAKAIDVLKKAIQIQPSVSKNYIDLGLSYYYLGNHSEAKKAFDLAAQKDPKMDRSQFPI